MMRLPYLALLCLILAAPALAAPCLPPGAPAVAGWALRNADAILVQDEAGTPRAVAVLEYEVPPAGTALRALVLGVEVIGLDLQPEDSGAPVWVDAGWVTETGGLRAVPLPRCQWRQLAGQAT